MGTISNPNTWPTYGGTYKDCSQGICSIYCPQWCYMIFPPPPPPFGPPDDDSATNFSPLIIGVIGILASAFLLISYYTLISKYCTRTRDQNPSSPEIETNRDQINQEQWQVGSTGLDEAVIKSITVCNYNKKDGLIEGTECAVCLNEFQENERLRLLPKCNHAFHLPCIDTWLKSHSNCPLCRSNVTFTSKLPLETPSSQTSLNLSISSLEIQRGNDLILVVDDSERMVHHGEVVHTLVSEVIPKNEISNTENSEISIALEGVQQFRRSISLGSFACRGHLLVADILRISEEDEDLEMKNSKISQGIGPSTGENSKRNGSIELKRSISTGRFMSKGHDKGKISILPN